MGRVRAPLAVVLLWTVTAALVDRASRGADVARSQTRRTSPRSSRVRRSRGWGHGRPPGRSWSRCCISAGITASALGDVIWLVYSWAGLEPDVSLADIPYYAGYLGLGAAMLVIVLKHRTDVRRVDIDAAIDALTVVSVSVLVLWSVAVHGIVTDDVDVGDDARRPRGLPRRRRRAAGAGAPRPVGAPPPGGPGLPLRGRRGLLARLRPRLPAVPGLGHGVGPSSTWAGWSAAS